MLWLVFEQTMVTQITFWLKLNFIKGQALRPYFFAFVMDEVTRNIQGDIPWCMLFADDVVLVDESQVGVNRKLEL